MIPNEAVWRKGSLIESARRYRAWWMGSLRSAIFQSLDVIGASDQLGWEMGDGEQTESTGLDGLGEESGEESYSLLCRLYLKDSEDGLDEAQADSVDRSSIPYRQTMEIVQLALSIGPAVFHRWRCGATTRSEYLPPTDSWPWMSWTHGIRMMVVGTRHKTSRDLLRETGPCPCSSTVAGW